MLYERTGLSADKKNVIEKYNNETDLKPEEIFRNPYVLEFLGLEEKPSYTETNLEEAIITHLQNFLPEMGRGFVLKQDKKE